MKALEEINKEIDRVEYQFDDAECILHEAQVALDEALDDVEGLKQDVADAEAERNRVDLRLEELEMERGKLLEHRGDQKWKQAKQ